MTANKQNKWEFRGCSIRLGDRDVARVYQYGLSDEEFNRRGHLIAAAPELLEALSSFPSDADYASSDDFWKATAQWWTTVATKAIAKAGGAA